MEARLSSLFAEPQVHTKATIDKFLNENCKSGNITLDQAPSFFDSMIRVQPIPRISSFNKLFSAVVKSKQYDHVISLQKRLNAIGMSPDFISLNALINCFCGTSRVWMLLWFLGVL